MHIDVRDLQKYNLIIIYVWIRAVGSYDRNSSIRMFHLVLFHSSLSSSETVQFDNKITGCFQRIV